MSMPLKYDMPGPVPYSGTGDSIVSVGYPIWLLSDAEAKFNPAMVGKLITISGAVDPDHNGSFVVYAVLSLNQIQYTNTVPGSSENPFGGTWSIELDPPDGPILAYDAAEIEDDELMLSGPHTGTGGSTPPGSWPNPGPNDVWDGPYGPELRDWTNTSHPGANMTQGGWSPPNRALKYDTSIPTGYYTRISTRSKRSRQDPSVSMVSEP